jgi:hypothetical protein
MNREVHVRFWEHAEVKSLRATRQQLTLGAGVEYARSDPISGPYVKLIYWPRSATTE